MDLVTISYRPQCLVRKFDAKGKLIAEAPLLEPIVMTALPRVTAMRYSHLPDFTIEPYVLESHKSGHLSKPKNVNWDKIGTKGAKRQAQADRYDDGDYSAGAETTHDIHKAARTGNLAAAINNQ